MAESEEELKSLEESESENVGLKLRKLRSWHLVPSLHGKQMGKQWRQCQTLFWGAPKSLQMVIAAMKLRHSLEGKLRPTWIAFSKADITLLTKAHLVKAMVFPVVMYGCKSWTVKKAEH